MPALEMDRTALNDLLCRFFQSFDIKDWSIIRECLSDTVWTDYSSFRDVAPGNISGDRYVAQRKAALSALDMQHNFLNLRVDVNGETASGRCNYVIHRFDPMGPAYFHSYGRYEFGFQRISGDWRLARIRQVLLRNEGDPEIHGATRSVNNTRNV